VRAVPAELVFTSVSAGEAVTGEVALFGYLEQPLEIPGFVMADRATAENFKVTVEPLSDDRIGQQQDARSGVLLKVTVEPGLPRGPFRQTILLRTNLECSPAVAVPIAGTVASDISIAGPDWDNQEGVLNIGTVNSANGARRRLLLIASGPHRKEVKPKLAQAVGEPLKVELGETAEMGGGAVSRTELSIQIPPGSPPVNCLGGEHGRPAEILIDTGHPEIPQLHIRVRYAVEQ